MKTRIMKSKLSCGNYVHFIFSSILIALLITTVISSAITISVSYSTIPSSRNASTNMNTNTNTNMNASIINSNITHALRHIDQAKAALHDGDTEGVQKHLDLARQNMVTGICLLWQQLNQEFLPIGPGSSTPMANLSKTENTAKQSFESDPLHTIQPVPPLKGPPISPKGPIKQPTSPASNLSKGDR
jgi:hypothetical protein